MQAADAGADSIDRNAAPVIHERNVQRLMDVANPVPRYFNAASLSPSEAVGDARIARSALIALTMHVSASGQGSVSSWQVDVVLGRAGARMIGPCAGARETPELPVPANQLLDPLPSLVPDLAIGELADDPVAEVVPRQRLRGRSQREEQQPPRQPLAS